MLVNVENNNQPDDRPAPPLGLRPRLHLLISPTPGTVSPEAPPWSEAAWDEALVTKLLRSCDDELDDALIAWTVTRMHDRGRLSPKLCWLDGVARRLEVSERAEEFLSKVTARRRWAEVSAVSTPPPPASDEDSTSITTSRTQSDSSSETAPSPTDLDEPKAFAAYLESGRDCTGLGLLCSRVLLELEQGRRREARALWREDQGARRPRLVHGMERWLDGGCPPLSLRENDRG